MHEWSIGEREVSRVIVPDSTARRRYVLTV